MDLEIVEVEMAEEPTSTILSGGAILDLENPDPNVFTIESIADSLSKIPRFCGNTSGTWTVAAHSVVVSYFCKDEYKLHGLLHDAAEVVLSDIPTPVKNCIKKELSAVCEEAAKVLEKLENRILNAIFKAFGLEFTPEAKKDVKKADLIVRDWEAKFFMPPIWFERFASNKNEIVVPPSQIWCPMLNNNDASRRMFLKMFEQYSRGEF